jgi:hypothetical protein
MGPPGFQHTLTKFLASRPGGGVWETCWYAHNMAEHACECLLCGVCMDNRPGSLDRADIKT